MTQSLLKVLTLLAPPLAIFAGPLFVPGDPSVGEGGEARNRLAAINADGPLVGWPPRINNTVLALAVSGSVLQKDSPETQTENPPGLTQSSSRGMAGPRRPKGIAKHLHLQRKGSMVHGPEERLCWLFFMG